MRSVLGMAVFVGAGLIAGAQARAEGLWLPALFGDHMVVQAGQGLLVWGKDTPGARVTVALANVSAQAQAGADGRWSAQLAALPVGGPHTLTVTGSATRRIDDVLVGEVWIGSGQSNMELALGLTKDHAAELAKAELPRVRLFTVDHAALGSPAEDLGGKWVLCTPDTAKAFSAVAFHFGRELSEALDSPVGIIESCWGGTPAEDWIPRPALDASEPTRSLVAGWDKEPGRKAAWSQGMAYDLQVKDLRLAAADGRELPLPLEGWGHGEKPGSTGALEGGSGVLRYRGLVQGAAWGSAQHALAAKEGGPLDLRPYDSVVFKAKGSGKFIVLFGQPSVLDYDYYASAPFTLGSRWTAQRLPIRTFKQGGWGEWRAFTPESVNSVAFGIQVPYMPELGGVAYNGMIAPLTRYKARGVLWYQGESNVGRADQYADLLTLLVKTWRQAWGRDDLAFLTVQLPGFAEAGSEPGKPLWAALRAAQARAMDALPHAAYAVALDLGEPDDIHPKDKKPVGRRLALAALATTYGKPVEYCGPRAGALSFEAGKLRLQLSHAQGLTLTASEPRSFEIAGKDGKFHRAHALVDGSSLLLWSKAVADPSAARYAWSDDPQAELYNGDGLPAGPFSVALP